MEEDKFSFHWKDSGTNFITTLRELHRDKDFCDVTLACEGVQMQAHKVVLSASSTFFRGILKSNPHPHPLLYLNGVTSMNLQSIVKFIYHGEVRIAKEELASFLVMAKDLKVDGLNGNNFEDSVASTFINKSAPTAAKPAAPRNGFSSAAAAPPTPVKGTSDPTYQRQLFSKLKVNNNVPIDRHDVTRMNSTDNKQGSSHPPHKRSRSSSVKSSEDATDQQETTATTEMKSDESVGLTAFEIEQRDMKAEFHRRNPVIEDGRSLHSDYNGESCTLASSWSDPRSSKQGSRNHGTGTENDFEEHASEFVEINGTSFLCTLCQKTFKTSNVVHRHVRTVHLNRPVRCDKCGREFKSSRTLDQHTKNNSMNKMCMTNVMLLNS